MPWRLAVAPATTTRHGIHPGAPAAPPHPPPLTFGRHNQRVRKRERTPRAARHPMPWRLAVAPATTTRHGIHPQRPGGTPHPPPLTFERPNQRVRKRERTPRAARHPMPWRLAVAMRKRERTPRAARHPMPWRLAVAPATTTRHGIHPHPMPWRLAVAPATTTRHGIRPQRPGGTPSPAAVDVRTSQPASEETGTNATRSRHPMPWRLAVAPATTTRHGSPPPMPWRLAVAPATTTRHGIHPQRPGRTPSPAAVDVRTSKPASEETESESRASARPARPIPQRAPHPELGWTDAPQGVQRSTQPRPPPRQRRRSTPSEPEAARWR